MISPLNLIICGASEYQLLLILNLLQGVETTSLVIARNMTICLNPKLEGADSKLSEGNPQARRPMVLKMGQLGDGNINGLLEMLSVEIYFGIERLWGRHPSNMDLPSINILCDRYFDNELQGEKTRGSVQ